MELPWILERNILWLQQLTSGYSDLPFKEYCELRFWIKMNVTVESGRGKGLLLPSGGIKAVRGKVAEKRVAALRWALFITMPKQSIIYLYIHLLLDGNLGRKMEICLVLRNYPAGF